MNTDDRSIDALEQAIRRADACRATVSAARAELRDAERQFQAAKAALREAVAQAGDAQPA